MRPSASPLLWFFFATAILVVATGFFMSPEQHRYVYVPLLTAILIWGVVFELRLFISPFRFVESSPHQPKA
ncbi:MAG: hypothetical protein QOE70_917 [Chthoniobacter sp.]|jgi:hypothetical protein|nr:hypothetical protein [Chthoniobacter sp.]